MVRTRAIHLVTHGVRISNPHSAFCHDYLDNAGTARDTDSDDRTAMGRSQLRNKPGECLNIITYHIVAHIGDQGSCPCRPRREDSAPPDVPVAHRLNRPAISICMALHGSQTDHAADILRIRHLNRFLSRTSRSKKFPFRTYVLIMFFMLNFFSTIIFCFQQEL